MCNILLAITLKKSYGFANNFNLFYKLLELEADTSFIASIDTIEAINDVSASNIIPVCKKLG